MDSPTPFRGQRNVAPTPTRVLHRFEKAGNHRAEICERTVAQFRAIEYLVFVDGSLLESKLFHGGREANYSTDLAGRVQQFLDGGWTEVPSEGQTPNA